MTMSPPDSNLPAVPEPEFNSVNELMRRVDEINAKDPTELTDRELDVLIAYHRRNRAKKAAGIKPTRARNSGTAMPLAELLGNTTVTLTPSPAQAQLPKPAAPANRSGLRRF